MPSNFEMESKGEIVLMVTFIYFNDSEDLGMSSGFGWSATISDVALNEPSVSTFRGEMTTASRHPTDGFLLVSRCSAAACSTTR